MNVLVLLTFEKILDYITEHTKRFFLIKIKNTSTLFAHVLVVNFI